MPKQRTRSSFSLLLILAIPTFIACSKQSSPSTQQSEQANASPSLQVPATQAANTPTPLALLPVAEQKQTPRKPPDVKEVVNAVSRVFDKVVTPESQVAVGDFNGDGSEDLAVVVKPAPETLRDLNNELANWFLEDPRIVDTGTTRRPPDKPTQAVMGDTLLAIIHGIGPDGWRNHEAKQTFVLKNGAGKAMTSQSPSEARNSKDRKQPALRGDAIRETIAGEAGMIYWTGAKYAWYSPGLQ